MIGSAWRQLNKLRKTLLVIYAPTFGVLLAAVLLRRRAGIPFELLFRDPAASQRYPIYVGIVSNLGILLWSGCAAVCFVAYRSLQASSRDKEVRRLLLIAAIGTLTLCLDDLFMFHEFVFPTYLHVPEKLVQAVYVAVFAFLFLRSWAAVKRTEFVLLFLSLGLFALSLAADGFPLGRFQSGYLVEDGLKLAGIVTWAAYFVRLSFQTLGRVPNGAGFQRSE